MPKYLQPGDKVLVRNLSPRDDPGKLRLFWEQEVAEVMQRHENDVTYTIRAISQPEKVRTLHRNMLMPVNHILQTIDDALNICFINPQKKVKSAMRKEAIEQDQRDLLCPSNASESDEEELDPTLGQLLQLHSITPQVLKQR